jgi:DNA adenine methylase
MSIILPPLKIQGIKTRLIPHILNLCSNISFDTYYEPFCGSGVVALNLQPDKAVLSDINPHITQLYKDLQLDAITPEKVRQYLEEISIRLKNSNGAAYYKIRDKFNAVPNSLDFIFLSRACFNGVIRFNSSGKFNTPFCRRPGKFTKSYITKVVNIVRKTQEIIKSKNWQFVCGDYKEILKSVKENDLVYVDPPYVNRNTNYYNLWSEKDEKELARILQRLPCKFILSSWYDDGKKINIYADTFWIKPGKYKYLMIDHFYHVGARLSSRFKITEVLIYNF